MCRKVWIRRRSKENKVIKERPQIKYDHGYDAEMAPLDASESKCTNPAAISTPHDTKLAYCIFSPKGSKQRGLDTPKTPEIKMKTISPTFNQCSESVIG